VNEFLPTLTGQPGNRHVNNKWRVQLSVGAQLPLLGVRTKMRPTNGGLEKSPQFADSLAVTGTHML